MDGSRDWRTVAAMVLAAARRNQFGLTAAGLAYYAFNSLLPLALLAVVGVSSFEQLGTVATGVEYTTGRDAAQIESTLESLLGDDAGRTRAVVIAAVILLWSAVTMFQAVNVAFREVYGTRGDRSLWRAATNTVLILATVLAAIVLLAVVGVALSVVASGTLWSILSVPLLFLGLLVVFVPMYYRFPGQEVTPREAVPGAAFAATVWTASALVFRLYATTSESIELYGVVGAVLLVLSWLYLGGLTLLLGALLNAILADRIELPEPTPAAT